MESEYIGWNSFIIFSIVVCILNVVIILFMIFLYYFYLDAETARPSGRELIYTTIGAIVYCNFLAFLMLLKPTYTICLLKRFSLELVSTIVYSYMIMNTSGLVRIFNSAEEIAESSRYLNFTSAFVGVLALTSVKFVTIMISLFLETPGIESTYIDKNEVMLKATDHSLSYIFGLIYNMYLIFVCVYYVIEFHNILEHYNKTVHICACMYVCCLILTALQCTYTICFRSSNYQTYMVMSAIIMSLNTNLIMIGLLFSKVWMLFVQQPDRNVRRFTISTAAPSQRYNIAYPIPYQSSFRGQAAISRAIEFIPMTTFAPVTPSQETSDVEDDEEESSSSSDAIQVLR